MKNTKLEMTKAEAAPATVPGGKVDFSEVADECFPGNTVDVAERVKAHLAAAALFGRLSLGHAIAAGWLLHSQRIHTPWGEWGNWCRDALGVTQQTANNYIGLFAATVGAARKVDGIPFENYITKREMESATLGMEDKSVTRAMVELGVVKRNPDHGGPRLNSGRHPKNVVKEVEEAAKDPDLSWAEAAGWLKGLREFGIESDGFGNLADDDLETVVAMLAELSRRAGDILSARKEGGAK